MRSDTDVGLTSDADAIVDICSGLDDGSMPDGDIIPDVCSGMDIGMESDLKALAGSIVPAVAAGELDLDALYAGNLLSGMVNATRPD